MGTSDLYIYPSRLLGGLIYWVVTNSVVKLENVKSNSKIKGKPSIYHCIVEVIEGRIFKYKLGGNFWVGVRVVVRFCGYLAQ